jgi:hypothetical protein
MFRLNRVTRQSLILYYTSLVAILDRISGDASGVTQIRPWANGSMWNVAARGLNSGAITKSTS